MRKILEELYHGNLSVDERSIRAGSKYARALAEVAKIEEALYEKVSEKDHVLLRDYALASARLANVSMVIHVIGTVNGQVNEGMRNIATHLAEEFEKENTVLYSGLKQIPQIVLNARRADVTMIFARANKLVYTLASIVTKMCRNTWIVLVQKPDSDFMARNNKHPLKCSYLSNLTAHTAFVNAFDFSLHILQWTRNDSNSIAFFICLGKSQQPIVLEKPFDEPLIFTL